MTKHANHKVIMVTLTDGVFELLLLFGSGKKNTNPAIKQNINTEVISPQLPPAEPHKNKFYVKNLL